MVVSWSGIRNFFFKFGVDIPGFPLQAVLSALENPTIDYFSLDIEGAEYAVLKTLDFKNKVDITVLGMLSYSALAQNVL